MKIEASELPTITLTLERKEDYEFTVRVDGTSVPDFIADEGPPLGESRGPSPEVLLGAATASCLSSSLLFCLNKARVPVEQLTARVGITMVRNERARLRVGSMKIVINAQVPDDRRDRFERCRELFEDYCVVTESVRHGIPIEVEATASSDTEGR
ncbi:OsmC family peroxiredoxin [bacterium]|nr:MAG: OsmC family peroxiredoxin [bacterium]